MVQEVTTSSWGSRIMSALWGVLFGIALILGGIYLVFWNEGNSLHTAQSLQQAHEILISVANTPINENNNMRVIYTSGLATTEDVLQDKLLNVSETAIQLHRNVEMYQWQEKVDTTTEKELGGSEKEVKTYSYNQIWSSDLINSSKFKDQSGHQNPGSMPLKSKTQYAKKVTVGEFNIPADMISEITGNTTVDLNKADIAALKEKFSKPVKIQGDSLYIGEDADMPKAGDLRVNVTTVLPGTVSIIAQQTGKTLQPYMAPAGKTVSLIEMGQVSPDEMIHNAEMSNRILTWVLRLVSLIMLILGFSLIMKPLSVLADVVPFIGSLVGFGTGVIAFICGLGLWTITIAIAWFTVRPLWSVGLLSVVGVICYLIYTSRKNKNLSKTT